MLSHVPNCLHSRMAHLFDFCCVMLLLLSCACAQTDLESMNAKVDSLRARWSSLNELTKRAKEVEKQQRLAAKTLKKGINSSTQQTFGSSAFAPRR